MSKVRRIKNYQILEREKVKWLNTCICPIFFVTLQLECGNSNDAKGLRCSNQLKVRI